MQKREAVEYLLPAYPYPCAVRVNHKKTHRIDCQEGLNLRTKRPRRPVMARHRRIRPEVSAVDRCWGMDFIADNLFNERLIRALTVVDNFSRRYVAIEVGQRL